MEELKSKSLLTIFAYAPAGFGHLRVTDALNDGFPKEARHPLLLGSHDPVLEYLHRIASNNILIRRIFEWSQYGLPEDIFTILHRSYLRLHTKGVYEQLLTILDQRFELPTRVLVVATHYALAHQIGRIKKRFQREKGIPLTLVVQVTDDSPQHVWYVPEADMTFVPSEYTKHKLEEYGRASRFNLIPITVSAYPITPILGGDDSPDFCNEKFDQIQSKKDHKIEVAIPISGAAAGLNFLSNLMLETHKKINRFFFHVVIKASSFTESFINEIIQHSFVDIHAASTYRDAVTIYEEVYKKNMISIEITKPSEQAFKALLHPTQLGGSILLFVQPIGRQERDNLEFLRRNNLIPHERERNYLWERATKNVPLDTHEGQELYVKAGQWRGLELPIDPMTAANFISYCLQNNIFVRMMNCKLQKFNEVLPSHLRSSGVENFWIKVNELLKINTGLI